MENDAEFDDSETELDADELRMDSPERCNFIDDLEDKIHNDPKLWTRQACDAYLGEGNQSSLDDDEWEELTEDGLGKSDDFEED